MKGGVIIRQEDLRAALDDVTPHLQAIDGGIIATAAAGPAIRRLYALAQLSLVNVSDDREPLLKVAG